MRIIHLLNWKLNDIELYLDEIKKCGFDAIQINPMQPFKNTGTFNWWASYQPLDFKIGNEFGNRADLQHLCQEAKKRDIGIIVDIVCNHMANSGDGYLQMLSCNSDVAARLKNNSDFWKKHQKVHDFKNWQEVVSESIGLPGLNLKNADLQKMLFDYLEELRVCGVKGYRIDAAKHIGLPSDGNDFFIKMGEYAKKNNLMVYGEFLGDYIDKKNELAKYINVLTEPSAHIDNADHMVTFVESHDTFLNDDGCTRFKSFVDIINEYNVLCENYNNTIFYVRDHFKPFNPWGRTSIKDNLRREDNSYISLVLNDRVIKEANLKKAKSSKKMHYDEKLFKDTCMNIHNLILNNVSNYTCIDINQIVQIIIYDYEILSRLNQRLDISSSDEIDIFLLDCIMYELYKNNKIPMHSINYNECYVLVLNELKKHLLNESSIYNSINENIVNAQIRKLNKKTS